MASQPGCLMKTMSKVRQTNRDGVKSDGSSSKRENYFLILTMSISPRSTFISYLPMESPCVIAQSFHCRKKHTKAPQ